MGRMLTTVLPLMEPARMMEDAGFTGVTWKNYTGGIAAVHVAKKPE